MARFRFAIFDCDGTLVDTEAACNAALHRALSAKGLRLSERELFELVIGQSTDATVGRLRQLLPDCTSEDLAETIEAAEMVALDEPITALPSARATLERWHGRCCVASNGSHAKMAKSLARCGLIDLADRRFSSEDVATPKPAPDLFLFCAQQNSVAPNECVVIEDSEAGLRAAQAAGMTAYGLTHLLPSPLVFELGATPIESLTVWLTLPESFPAL